MSRVLVPALSFGILGAFLGAVLRETVAQEPVARALCPLLCWLAFTVVGAIAGATDAIVEAINRAGSGSAPPRRTSLPSRHGRGKSHPNRPLPAGPPPPHPMPQRGGAGLLAT